MSQGLAQGSFNPKIRFLGQKVCSVAHEHTHFFRVSGVFPSTYHQGSAQHITERHQSMICVIYSIDLHD